MNKATIVFLIAKMKVALHDRDLVYAFNVAERLFNLGAEATALTAEHYIEANKHASL